MYNFDKSLTVIIAISLKVPMFSKSISLMSAALVLTLVAASASAQKVHTVSYLPHWVMGAGYMNGAFEDQAPLLDEITYFGEFRFRSDGRIAVGNNGAGGSGGTSVLNMPNVNDPNTWSLNQSDSRISQMANAYNKVSSVSPATRTTFTIGGWENSTNFHVFTDGIGASSKAAFAAQQVRKILDLSGGKLTGVDLDWEDGCSLANCPLMESNAASYGNLTAAIRDVLQSGETQTAFIQDFRFNAGAAIIGNMDSLRLSTYDAPHGDASGHHTSVTSAMTIINRWINNGYDKSKLSVGSGFYGRTLSNPFGGPSSTFAQLDATHRGSTGEWLDDSSTTYIGQGFDGPDSIAAKIDFIRDTGLNEIFSWKLSDDNLSKTLDSSGRSHYLALTKALHDAAAAAGLAGDYNDDGIVNAADYTVWLDSLGAIAGTLPNDVAGGVIGQAQYSSWKSNFGNTSASASQSVIPEPASLLLVIFGLIGCSFGRSRSE